MVLVCSTACLVIPGYLLPFFEETNGYKITTTCVLFFFVLVNAFYGGAMTMFFTSELSIPFETVRDAIRAYPDWELMFQEGMYFDQT